MHNMPKIADALQKFLLIYKLWYEFSNDSDAPMDLKLRSSKSSVQLTAAGHVDQNSSAYLGHSFAAIWELPNLVHVPRSGRLDADLDERSFCI